jgi:hypothetical protein
LKAGPSMLLTLTVGVATAVAIWATTDLPLWAVFLLFPPVSLVPSLIIFSSLAKLTDTDESILKRSASSARGVKNGYFVVVFMIIPLFFSRPFLYPHQGASSFALLLFPMELLVLSLGTIVAAVESALEFRLWVGGRGLDDLKAEELSDWLAGQTPRIGFRSFFWGSVPWIIRGKKNLRSVSVLPPGTIATVAAFLALAFFFGFQPWASVLLSLVLSYSVFFTLWIYSYKKALTPFDGEQLTSLAKKISLVRERKSLTDT